MSFRPPLLRARVGITGRCGGPQLSRPPSGGGPSPVIQTDHPVLAFIESFQADAARTGILLRVAPEPRRGTPTLHVPVRHGMKHGKVASWDEAVRGTGSPRCRTGIWNPNTANASGAARPRRVPFGTWLGIIPGGCRPSDRSVALLGASTTLGTVAQRLRHQLRGRWRGSRSPGM